MPLKFPWVLHPPPSITNASAPITTFQWLVISLAGFAALAFIVVKFVVPVIRGMLNERREAIEAADAQVKATLADAERMRNDYRQRLENIEEETKTRLEAAVAEAGRLREQILEEARGLAADIVRRGEEEVAQERAKAQAHLRIQFVDSVIRAAGYAASRSLTDADQGRLLGEFVREVESAR
jgi:F0F1-type ATP synthase membrane subunit b/b'